MNNEEKSIQKTSINYLIGNYATHFEKTHKIRVK